MFLMGAGFDSCDIILKEKGTAIRQKEVSSMTKRAKQYQKAVVEVLMKKYKMQELEAYKAIRATFLYDSLIYYADETIHDDVETNADAVFEDYIRPELLRM